MRLVPIGAILLGLVLLAMIATSRAPAPPLVLEDARTGADGGGDGLPMTSPLSTIPTVHAVPEATEDLPHEDPPAPGERGATNYADKGVLPAL